MEVHKLLQRVQINHTELTPFRGIGQSVLFHDLTGALNRSGGARFADKHVMRLFGKHEAARSRERIKGRFGKRRKLKFTVAIGKEGKHEECKPVPCLLVEGGE